MACGRGKPLTRSQQCARIRNALPHPLPLLTRTSNTSALPSPPFPGHLPRAANGRRRAGARARDAVRRRCDLTALRASRQAQPRARARAGLADWLARV
eukprot:6207518-Pleurochrysis_carterae.AAC.2